jgi:hypothetical protein
MSNLLYHYSSDSSHSMGNRLSYNAFGGLDSCSFSHGSDRNIIQTDKRLINF